MASDGMSGIFEYFHLFDLNWNSVDFGWIWSVRVGIEIK